MTVLSAIITPTNVVTNDNTATLTNKTLTSPVINTGTLNTPNIAAGLELSGDAGTAGYLLTSAGSGSAPVWAAAPDTGLSQAKATMISMIFGF